MALGGLMPLDEDDEEERRRREAEAMGMATPSFDDTVMQTPAGTDPGSGAAAAPAAQPAQQPLVLAQPADVSKTVTSGVRASPESRRAMQEHEAAGTALVDATTREAQAKRDQAQTANQAGYDTASKEAEHAKGRQKFQQEHMEWLKRVDEHAERDVKHATERVEREYQEQGKDYWADKPWWAKVLAAVAVASSHRNLRIMGEDPSKSAVQATIDGAIEQDRKAKTAKVLKSQEYLTLAKSRPAEARAFYDKRLKDFDAEQAADLMLVSKEAAKLKASKALDPAQVDAQVAIAVATAREKAAEGKVKMRQHYEPRVTRTEVDSGPGKPASEKPASEGTRDIAVGDELYEQMANRQRELIRLNDGKIPITGTLAQEFETNDRKMATILQKPLGKSDSDAATARKLQASPDYIDKGRQVLGGLFGGGKQPVENYMKSLEVNAQQLRDEAAARLKGEGKPAPARRAPPASDPYAGASLERLEKALGKAKANKDADGVADLERAIREKKGKR